MQKFVAIIANNGILEMIFDGNKDLSITVKTDVASHSFKMCATVHVLSVFYL